MLGLHGLPGNRRRRTTRTTHTKKDKKERKKKKKDAPQRHKVADGARRDVGAQLDDHPPRGAPADGHVEEAARALGGGAARARVGRGHCSLPGGRRSRPRLGRERKISRLRRARAREEGAKAGGQEGGARARLLRCIGLSVVRMRVSVRGAVFCLLKSDGRGRRLARRCRRTETPPPPPGGEGRERAAVERKATLLCRPPRHRRRRKHDARVLFR